MSQNDVVFLMGLLIGAFLSGINAYWWGRTDEACRQIARQLREAEPRGHSAADSVMREEPDDK